MDIIENRAELVAALRSGEYKHARKAMRNNENMYCPLGIACEIYRKHHPETSRWVHIHPQPVYSFQVDSNKCLYASRPPYEVKKFFGLDGFTTGYIMVVNDNKLYSLEECADYIENLPYYEEDWK